MSLEQWAGPAPTTVAVCFTDIVGSTALCNSIGDRQWIEVLVKHFKKARSFICQYNCHEIKIIGDSFMVVFRTAVDALNFAMAFQEDTCWRAFYETDWLFAAKYADLIVN